MSDRPNSLNKFNVTSIPYEDTKPFILVKHYAQRMPSISHSFGLFHQGLLCGIVAFGKPAGRMLCEACCGEEYKHLVLELNRLVLDEDLPKNAASYLVGRSIKLLPKPSILVSYADIRYGHIGYIYQATNWIYTGLSADRTDRDSGDKHSRHYKGDNKTIRRSRKHRYFYFHANKSFRKILKKALKYKAQPYPKGETQRHNLEIEFYKQDQLDLTQNGGV